MLPASGKGRQSLGRTPCMTYTPSLETQLRDTIWVMHGRLQVAWLNTYLHGLSFLCTELYQSICENEGTALRNEVSHVL